LIIFARMITLYIIAVTVVVSVMAMNNFGIKSKLMFNPYMVSHNNEWYRFFTSGFIHADYFHLGFNMFSLYMFGGAVERGFQILFGEKAPMFYLILYISALAMSSLYEYEKNKNNVYYNALGASGAVSSVIFAFIILAPTQTIYFVFLPIPIPAFVFGLIFLSVEYYMAQKGNTNIGHTAHFWGAIHGVVFTLVLKPTLFLSFIEQIKG
jgi:membrane associated rhomboid family serine protease